mgnify:FL=1
MKNTLSCFYPFGWNSHESTYVKRTCYFKNYYGYHTENQINIYQQAKHLLVFHPIFFS